jgi:Protein kinase domain
MSMNSNILSLDFIIYISSPPFIEEDIKKSPEQSKVDEKVQSILEDFVFQESPLENEGSQESTPKQATATMDENRFVKDVFDQQMKNSGPNKNFSRNEIIKISRRKHPELKSSYVIKKLGQKRDALGNPMFISKDLHLYDVKIYKVVHGNAGILGEGYFKRAKYIYDPETGEKLVIAKFKNLSLQRIEYSYAEIPLILKEVEGLPYVNAGHYVVIPSSKNPNESNVYILSNYAKADFEKTIKKSLSIQTKRVFASQLLQGLAGVHEKGLAHCDIKPANIHIMDTGREETANLADFDLATSQKRLGKSFTPIYRAPEIVRKYKEPVSIEELQKGDVYALGVCFFEMYHGKHPWYDSTIANFNEVLDNYKDITLDRYNELFPEPSTESEEHIIWEMMHPDPSIRPSVRDALGRFEMFSGKV